MRILLLAAAIITLGLCACSGGGDGDEIDVEELEAYIEDLQDIVDDYNAKAEGFDFFNLNTGFGETAFNQVRQDLSDSVDLGTRRAEDMDLLEPPDGVANLHEELITTTRELVAFFDELSVMESQDDLTDFLLDHESRFLALVFNSVAACYEMQALAEEHDIDANLCEPDGPSPISLG